ncbi:hypothetical protein FRC18_003143 [Serendipita sp. 400]|nr:hypothetical protein FRC18_003143 [Serendipita sp. 400]
MVHIAADGAPTSPILAKGGRGGGGHSSGGGVSDSWNAPPLVKTIFAFQLIWFILILVQSLQIFKGIKFVGKSPRSSKAPYILGAFVALCVSIYYLLGAINTRMASGTGYDIQAYLNLLAATGFMFDIDISFRPIVILWLCHLRGVFTGAGADVKGDKRSFVASTWKKILDWSLVIIVLALGVAYSSLAAWYNNAAYNGDLTSTQSRSYKATFNGLNRSLEAFIAIFAINIVVTLICLKVAQKRERIADKVVTRLLAICVPFVVIDAVETIAAEIFASTQEDYDLVNFRLALVIIEGTCRFMIFAGIIASMKFSSAPQSAHQNEYSAVSSGGYSINSQQPLYPAAPAYQTPPPPMTIPPQQQGWGAPPMVQQQQGYLYQAPYGPPPANQGWQR